MAPQRAQRRLQALRAHLPAHPRGEGGAGGGRADGGAVAPAAGEYAPPPLVARSTTPPHAPLGRPPRDGEAFAASAAGYLTCRYRGWLYPCWADVVPMLDAARRTMRLRGGAAGDIIVATYPKCGTTWTQVVLLTLLAQGARRRGKGTEDSPWIEARLYEVLKRAAKQGEEFRADEEVEKLRGWEPGPGVIADGVAPRRVWKTHAPAELAPWAGGATEAGVPRGARVVVVSRNPKDAAVSMFHHARGREPGSTGFKYTGDWPHFLRELWVPGHVESGDFWAWHAGWWRARQALPPDRLLWITYEELQADAAGVARRLAMFCGIPCDDATAARVAARSGFSEMRQDWTEKNPAQNHIRQGTSGSWRGAMTAAESRIVDEVHARRCAAEGLPPGLFDFA